MIGYNVEKIEELAKKLADKYKNVGEKMGEGWPGLSATLEAEWVGPDELSYENQLAKNICELYHACRETTQVVLDNIKTIGTNWKNFQRNNILEGAEQVGVERTTIFGKDIFIPSLEDHDIESTVKAGDVTFSESTNLGLTNDGESGSTIKTKFDEYIDGVYNSVKGLYSDFDSSTAFLGTELSAKVNEYISNVAESLAKLTTCHKSIYEALDKLTANYATHESDQATEVSSKGAEGIDFGGQNLRG